MLNIIEHSIADIPIQTVMLHPSISLTPET